jgi:two-component system, response regulator
MKPPIAGHAVDQDTIVVVDDDAEDRNLLMAAFRVSQCKKKLVMSASGEELVNHLQKLSEDNLPNLILLDINMPGMDGKQVLKTLKNDSLYKRIPIVVLTTTTSTKEKRKCYELGANGFVTKPSKFNEFVELIDSISKIWC